MTRCARPVLFAALLALAAASAPAQAPAVGDGWYTVEDADFSLDMPGRPEHERTDGGVGPVYDVYRVSAGGVNYALLFRAIGVSKNPRDFRALALKGHAIGYTAAFADGLRAQGVKARVTFDRDLRLGEFPGKQYRVTSDMGPGVIRFYATNRRLYSLQVLGAGEEDKGVAEFLKSFKVGGR